MTEKLRLFIENNLESNTFIKFNKFKYSQENASCSVMLEDENLDKKIDKTYLDIAFDIEEDSFYQADKEIQISKCRNLKIEDFINNNQDINKFQKLLFSYIDSKELKDSDVYNKVHIDRRLFSKIRSDIDYHPSKETVILLGLALELKESEIEELLNSASYSLPKNNVYDLIIRFCFIEGIYDLIEVNSLLDSYECKLFEC
jgi:hypothetical protein